MQVKPAVATLLALATAGCNSQSTTSAYDVKTLMATHVQPTAEIYWNSVQYISDASGERKIEPKTDAEWARTQEAAAQLRGFAEQLGSPAASVGRGTDWADFAKGMADISTQAEQAAKERDPEKVFQVGGSIYNVCSACHEVYMPTPGGAGPAGAAATPAAK